MPNLTNTIRRKRIVVHLGNIGYHDTSTKKEGEVYYKSTLPANQIKTHKYAKRFRDIDFIGIDLKKYTQFRPKNWMQMQLDFLDGLKKLENNSIDLISSEMSVGYYTKGAKEIFDETYNRQLLNLAYQKLVPGGKLMIALTTPRLKLLRQIIIESQFPKRKRKIKLMTKKEQERTYWLQKYNAALKPEERYAYYQIILEK